MLLVIVLVFAGVFVVTALLLTALGAGASAEVKQTLAVLDSALGTPKSEIDDIVDIRREELLSSLPWLNRLLLKLDLAPQLRLLLYQADLNWTVGGVLLMSLACWAFMGAIVYLRTGNVLAALILSAILAAAPFLYVFHKRSQRFDRFEQKLPDALQMMVSALRAGNSLIAAIGVVSREVSSPIDREFRKCFDEQNFGLELRTAMINLTTRVPIQDVRIVVAAILIQKESGGNLAEVLEKAAHIIRERFQLKRQIRVHTAQGRLTGWILSVLPVVLGIALYLVNPEQMSILWKRPIGLKMIYASVVMTILGTLIIRKIVRIRV